MKAIDVSPLRVGGFVVPVEIENQHLHVAGLVGRYLGDEPRIIIRDDLTAQTIAETVLHETLHAIVEIYLEGMADNISEHVVAMISQGLFQVLQDNPELTEYVSG